MHSEKFKLDFRTKMLMSLCLSYTLILGNIQTKFSIVAAAYSLLPYVFLLLNREKKAAVKGILFIMAAYIIQKEWVFSAGGFLGSLFLFITMMFLRLLPGFVMARFALASSTMSHMTSALKKMHFPVVLIIPITVMARFFHTAREVYNQVKDAMYLHGLTNRRLFFHPVKLFEYRMVPLFMVLTKTADVIKIMEDTICINQCLNEEENCNLKATDYCPVRRFYLSLQEQIESELKHMTFEMLRKSGGADRIF